VQSDIRNQTSKKPRIFYGWWIVAVVFVVSAYCSGIIFYGFTAIMEPVVKEFGWTYAQVSFAASLRGLEAGLISPVAGFLINKLGPRKLVFGGVLIIGIGLFLFGLVSSLWMFYAVFFIISLGLSTSTGVVTNTVIGNWFRRNVSKATSIAMCGTAFGGLLVPIVSKSIEVFDWRTTMVLLSVGTFIIILPLTLLIRYKPEQYGYLPDGEIDYAPVAEVKSHIQGPAVKDVLKQAMRSRVFWLLSVGFTCHILSTASVITHIMPYLGSIGIEKSVSAMAAGGVALAGLVGRLTFGWLGDKFDKRKITAVSFGLTIIGLLILEFIPLLGQWALAAYVIVFGLSFAAPIPMLATITLDYFGREKMGPVLGLATGLTMFGGMIGPPFAGWVFDTFRAYDLAWYVSCVIIAAGALCMLAIPSLKSAGVEAWRQDR